MIDPVQIAARQGIDPWEAAYLRFETPEEEIRKFTERLRRLGVSKWPRETTWWSCFAGAATDCTRWRSSDSGTSREWTCRRGCWRNTRGMPAAMSGDCRELPFADKSKDAAIVQGGLHTTCRYCPTT